MTKIHVIHENDEWSLPLFAALATRNLEYESWHLDSGHIDLSAAPPDGLFYNRMSASSHTRDHRYAPEYTAAVLSWLETHDRPVRNGSRALQLELSKVAQYTALERHGIRTPRTLAATGRAEILAAAATFDGRFITKHNRAGKGLGVYLFDNTAELAAHLDAGDYDPPIDGILLLQQYIEAPEPFITRMEFIGGELFYAVRVDTSDGFQLCPADICDLPDSGQPKFQIIEGFDTPRLSAYQRFLRNNGIHVAGIEFIVDADGAAYTYDVNTNTNYNSDAEAAAGLSGMARLADYLGRELAAASDARPLRMAG